MLMVFLRGLGTLSCIWATGLPPGARLLRAPPLWRVHAGVCTRPDRHLWACAGQIAGTPPAAFGDFAAPASGVLEMPSTTAGTRAPPARAPAPRRRASP